MLRRMRSKKGFTLAELLIVVAIIAVLVAIAVPLFVNALNGAEEKVKEANKRAVRGAAVAEILMHYEEKGYELDEGNTCWVATAGVTASGEVVGLAIAEAKAVATEKCDAPTEDEKGKYGSCKYVVVINISETEVA